MSDAKHTPTPWVFIPMNEYVYDAAFKYRIEGEDGFSPCCIYADGTKNKGTTEANAAFIVRACNSHDALVDALKKATDILERIDTQETRLVFTKDHEIPDLVKSSRQALADAEK